MRARQTRRGERQAPVSLGTAALFSSAASDEGSSVASYDVRYRRCAPRTLLGPWVAPSSWTGRTSAKGALSLTPGCLYCVQVRARDRAGNVSKWSAARCTTRQLDDRSLVASSGWVWQTGSDYYLGTATSARRSGPTLAVAVPRARRVAVMATTGPLAGRLGVYGAAAWSRRSA